MPHSGAGESLHTSRPAVLTNLHLKFPQRPVAEGTLLEITESNSMHAHTDAPATERCLRHPFRRLLISRSKFRVVAFHEFLRFLPLDLRCSRPQITTGTPLCDIPSGCCFFTEPWTVTRSSLRILRRIAAFCRPLRPVLLLVSFPRWWSPVVGWITLSAPFQVRSDMCSVTCHVCISWTNRHIIWLVAPFGLQHPHGGVRTALARRGRGSRFDPRRVAGGLLIVPGGAEIGPAQSVSRFRLGRTTRQRLSV